MDRALATGVVRCDVRQPFAEADGTARRSPCERERCWVSCTQPRAQCVGPGVRGGVQDVGTCVKARDCWGLVCLLAMRRIGRWRALPLGTLHVDSVDGHRQLAALRIWLPTPSAARARRRQVRRPQAARTPDSDSRR